MRMVQREPVAPTMNMEAETAPVRETEDSQPRETAAEIHLIVMNADPKKNAPIKQQPLIVQLSSPGSLIIIYDYFFASVPSLPSIVLPLVCLYLQPRSQTHTHIYMHTYTHTHSHTRVHVRTHTHAYIHTHTYSYTHTHIHTHMRIHVHAHTHIRTHHCFLPVCLCL